MDLASFLVFPDRGQDILESLFCTTRDDRAYTIPNPQWPEALTVAPGNVAAMPAKIVEEGENTRVVCRLGMLPQVDLGWASVDSKFFLWKFGTCGAISVEKEMPENISCIGLAKPRANVFSENIKHILIVCTSTEVVLLGLIFAENGACVEVQNLTFYSCPLDGRMIHTITASENGRIFMGGLDGSILEILYSTGAGILWSNPLCQKVVVNGSFFSLFLKPKEEDSIKQLLVDDQRNVLYSLDAAGRIQAYDLGSKGFGHPKNYAGCTDFWTSASKAISGRDYFSTQTQRRVVSIAIPSHSRSWRISLMAITSDGHRVFFGSHRPEKYDWLSAFTSKSQLKATVVRPAPCVESLMGTTGGSGVLFDREMFVGTIVNCCGGVVMAVSSDGNAATTEIMGFFSSPITASAVSNTSQSIGLQEELVRRAFEVEGRAVSLDEIRIKPSISDSGQTYSSHDELSAQIHESQKTFGLLTSHCSVVFKKKWPVDILAEMLRGNKLDVIRSFFTAYGAENASAMCFQLAAGTSDDKNVDVAKASIKILTDPGFGGEPQILSPAANANVEVESGLADVFETDSGSLKCSAAFYGLRTYIARLLEPIWRDHVFKDAAKGKLLQCNWNPKKIEWYGKRCQEALTASNILLVRWTGQRLPNGSIVATSSLCKQFETKLVQTARFLLKKVGDVMGLLQVLTSQSTARVMSRLAPDHIKSLRKLKLAAIVVENELPNSIDALLAEMTSDETELSDGVADHLSREASTLFNKDKKLYLKAFQKLQRAVLSGSSDKQRQKIITNALQQMKQVPKEIDVPLVAEPLYNIGNVEDFVNICLFAAFSPGWKEKAAPDEADSEKIWQRKNACYSLIFRALDSLLAECGRDAVGGESSQKLTRVLKAAIQSQDQEFLRELFERVCKDVTGGAHLIQLNSPDVSKFLHARAELSGRSPVLDTMSEEKVHYVMLLAQLYSKQGSHDESADLYKQLATRKSVHGQTPVPLADRILLLTKAQNQLCCINKESEEVNEYLHLAGLQQRILHRIEQNVAQDNLRPLEYEIKSLASLVDDYAIPHKLYDMTLEAISLIKDKISAKQMQNLWDRFLRNAWEEHGTLVDVCDCIKDMGKRLAQKPISFPAANICSILEAIGLGIWPESRGMRRPALEDKQLIQETVYAAFGGSWACVLDAYLACMDEDLKSKHPTFHQPQLVLEILKSLLVVFQHLCSDTFALQADPEIVTSRGLIKHLNNCLRIAKNVKTPSLQAEVNDLVAELESIQNLVSSRTQLMR